MAGGRGPAQQQWRQWQLQPVCRHCSLSPSHMNTLSRTLLAQSSLSLGDGPPCVCRSHSVLPSAATKNTQFRKLGYEAVDMICEYMTSVQDAKVVPDVQVGLVHRQQQTAPTAAAHGSWPAASDCARVCFCVCSPATCVHCCPRQHLRSPRPGQTSSGTSGAQS